MPQQNLAQKIYAAVRLIPKGKVASYSQVAALLGNCNLRRYVGNALHKNPSNSVTPCHRVVNAKGFCSGSFAFGGGGVQRQKLEAEGVTFTKGHVDMEKHAISQDDFDAMSARLGQEWGRTRTSEDYWLNPNEHDSLYFPPQNKRMKFFKKNRHTITI